MNTQNEEFKFIIIGDVVGKYGRRFLLEHLPKIKEKLKPDLVIANGENSAGGLGIIQKTADELFKSGVDIITTGNHVWDKKEALDLLDKEERIIRPLNFYKGVPGRGFVYFRFQGQSVIIVNLQGQVFMEPVVNNPFIAIDEFLKTREEKIIIVDFHAEATAEKQSLGFFLDGRVSAVLGTHTHVQTADLRIMDKGTAYQSDIGMTGSMDSIIGMKREPIIKKFLTGINQRFEVEKKNIMMNYSEIVVNSNTGRAISVKYHTDFED